jgi:hypothetical protein
MISEFNGTRRSKGCPVQYEFMAIEQNEIPRMKVPSLQYALDTYAGRDE